MKLAFLCYPYHRGGVTRWMADLAAEVQRQGGTSWFVAPQPRVPFINGRGRPTMMDLFAAMPDAERPILVAPAVGPTFEFGTAAYRSSVYAGALRSAVPSGVPVVVADDPGVWAAAAYLSPRNPMIAALHGDDVAYYQLATRYGDATAAITCVSQRVRRRSAALRRPSHSPLVRIPCGIPIRAARTTSPSSLGPLRLTWVGRMDESQKRVSDLPKIAGALRDAGFSFTFDLMGDGPARESLARSCAALGLDSKVRLHRWASTSDVLDLFARSDLLLMSSNYEGMPITVMEALSMGCGVVSSRVSGVEDYQMHSLAPNCLWTYDVGDVAGAADQIRAAASVARTVRFAAARALAECEFSIGVCAQRYAHLLTQLGPTRSVGRVSLDAGRAVTALVSLPVAAQRLARLYLARQYGRLRSATPASQPSTSQVA